MMLYTLQIFFKEGWEFSLKVSGKAKEVKKLMQVTNNYRNMGNLHVKNIHEYTACVKIFQSM